MDKVVGLRSLLTRTKTINLLAAIALVITAFHGGGSSSPAQSAESALPVLRVGVCAKSPPMIFKQGGQIVGVDADLAWALGQSLGRRVVFVEADWENLIDALSARRFDILDRFANRYSTSGLRQRLLKQSQDQWRTQWHSQQVDAGIPLKIRLPEREIKT